MARDAMADDDSTDPEFRSGAKLGGEIEDAHDGLDYRQGSGDGFSLDVEHRRNLRDAIDHAASHGFRVAWHRHDTIGFTRMAHDPRDPRNADSDDVLPFERPDSDVRNGVGVYKHIIDLAEYAARGDAKVTDDGRCYACGYDRGVRTRHTEVEGEGVRCNACDRRVYRVEESA